MDKVEDLDIDDYRLKLFTIFNDAVLHSFDPSHFQYKTDNENYNDTLRIIKEAREQGFNL